MSFNNGKERRKLNAKWEHLRVQYREAGMSEDAIQAMYEFDLGVLNSERAYITNTMTETSDFKQYEKAVTVTDTYHETKSRFAWIGEIENEQLLTALETLKVEDLEIITMYAYEGYDITEISKVYGVSRPTISIKIKRITKFLKNFNFNATN
jgi:RNA polymerase sigma factor (sigma-70 family)